jgi:hypothetical protein
MGMVGVAMHRICLELSIRPSATFPGRIRPRHLPNIAQPQIGSHTPNFCQVLECHLHSAAFRDTQGKDSMQSHSSSSPHRMGRSGWAIAHPLRPPLLLPSQSETDGRVPNVGASERVDTGLKVRGTCCTANIFVISCHHVLHQRARIGSP